MTHTPSASQANGAVLEKSCGHGTCFTIMCIVAVADAQTRTACSGGNLGMSVLHKLGVGNVEQLMQS